MHYQVPQFIDIESKIVGPLTIKQFLYLAAGFLIVFGAFFILKFFVWLVLTLIIGGLAIAFSFVKYNGRSFATLIVSLFKYFWKPRRYLSSKTASLPGRGLDNLNLKLNTSGQALKRERLFRLPFLEQFKTIKEKYEVFRKATGEQEVARRVDYR